MLVLAVYLKSQISVNKTNFYISGENDCNNSGNDNDAANNDSTNPVGELREAALMRTIQILRKKVANEQTKKREALKQKAALEGNMAKVFNEDQLASLSRGIKGGNSRGKKWSNETIRKGLQLWFSCGSTGYNSLLQQQLPLPSLRSLRRRLEFIHMEPGILCEVFSFLQIKVNAMNENERECCLFLDEMCIKAGLQYDRSSSCLRGDVTLPQHSGVATHTLVFMLGELLLDGNKIDISCTISQMFKCK